MNKSQMENGVCENASRLRAFVPETGARPIGTGLPQVALVKLNRLRTGVGRFHSFAPSPNCECGASEETANHVLTVCLIHRVLHGARGLTVLDDETRCWLNNITANSGLRSRSRSRSESEVLGRSRSRIVKKTRSRSRNILSDSDSSCPIFYILVMLTAQLTRPSAPV